MIDITLIEDLVKAHETTGQEIVLEHGEITRIVEPGDKGRLEKALEKFVCGL